jgi:hypothetical protein
MVVSGKNCKYGPIIRYDGWMIFSIYKRFEIEIRRQGGTWCAYRRSNGMSRPDPDIIIPSSVSESEIETYLDDLFHEYARPGDEIVRL